MLTEDEMIWAVEVAATLGVEKLRITGGEPLIKRNILSICQRAAAVAGIRDLSITTNGILLPKLAKPLREAGVSRVNLSIDTLNPKKYQYITRCGALEQAIEGLHVALDAGFEKIKINTVLIGGFNEDEIQDIALLTKQYPVDVRFIELMPMYSSGDFNQRAFIPCTTVLDKFPEAKRISPDGGVAQLYHLPDALGNIGLIRPLTEHFCAQCNRIRVTADGTIKPCLHAKAEFSIKRMCKEEMRVQFERAIRSKPLCHEELSPTCYSRAGRAMNQIGG